MKFQIHKKYLIEPLKYVVSATEQRSSLPILANILLRVEGTKLTLVGNDNEIEITSTIPLEDNGLKKDGETTVNAKKFYSIVQNLNDDSFSMSVIDEKATILAGKSKFSLSCLPATDYPVSAVIEPVLTVKLEQRQLKKLLSETSYAMAVNDPRFYLNGLCLDFMRDKLNVVATDGHRLAMSTVDVEINDVLQVILPHKAVILLQKSLASTDDIVEISIGENSLQAKISDYVINTRLIDGKFPDYHAVIPVTTLSIEINANLIKSVFAQVKILSHEKHKGTVLSFSENKLTVSARNIDGEKAESEIDIEYQNDQFEISFNIDYLLEALYALSEETVKFHLKDGFSSIVISQSVASLHSSHNDTKMIVMPMRIE